jgi:hypothetical protein
MDIEDLLLHGIRTDDSVHSSLIHFPVVPNLEHRAPFGVF